MVKLLSRLLIEFGRAGKKIIWLSFMHIWPTDLEPNIFPSDLPTPLINTNYFHRYHYDDDIILVLCPIIIVWILFILFIAFNFSLGAWSALSRENRVRWADKKAPTNCSLLRHSIFIAQTRALGRVNYVGKFLAFHSLRKDASRNSDEPSSCEWVILH